MNPTQGARGPPVEPRGGVTTTPSACPARWRRPASGQAAETWPSSTSPRPASHIVASPSLYGGTYNLFHYTLPKMGIEVTFVDDPDDLDAVARRPSEHQGVLRRELGNPKNDVLDIEGVARSPTRTGVPLIVDNTVATPYHPAVRVGRRHRRALGHQVHRRPRHLDRRRIVDGGTLRLRRSMRAVPDADRARPELPRPLDVLAGARPRPTSSRRACSCCATSAADRPFNAFLFLQGLETLSPAHGAPQRERRKVAAYLAGHAQVESGAYAGLPELARGTSGPPRTGGKGYGSVPAFDIKGGREAGQKFVEASAAQPRGQHRRRAQPGDPPGVSTTHSQLTEEEQAAPA
jgi:O-acetylhomoserine (thiol)-lyase